jgi:SAM-dependent methyltransferase
MNDAEPYLEHNRALWNEWATINARSEYYDLPTFKQGGNRLREFEIEEVGPVEGRSLLHLQCHIGTDTVSWARLGARVTGVDFSERAVEEARSLAAGAGIEARYVLANVYDAADALGGETFDVVYTSRGVLGWLPDIPRWAEVVARCVNPGGIFYIHEMHPFLYVFDDSEGASEPRVRFPYWSKEGPIEFPVQGSYADRFAETTLKTSFDWPHSLGEVVTALIDAGLQIEFLHDWPFLDWECPFLEQRGDLWFYAGEGELPLSFSLRARKPV